MSRKWVKLGDEHVRVLIETAISSQGSMRAAAASVPMNFATFRKFALRFGVWAPNEAGKGLKRKTPSNAFPLEEVLAGDHRGYGRVPLKRRLLKLGIKHNVCEICGIDSWNDKPLTMHLDHINGDPWDHKLENLRMLCPNCHSQTSTYCGRNA